MAAPELSLSLRVARLTDSAEHRAALPRAAVTRWIKAALGADVQAAEIGIRVVDAAEGQSLNRDYRQKDYPTNVLTFDYSGAPMLCADLVLCAPVVAREAAELKRPLAHHYTHLLVHGILHAQGWDHETSEQDAEAMEARETEILARLGVPDPYAEQPK